MILLVFLRRPVLLRVLWRCATTSFVLRAGAPAAGHRPRHSFRQHVQSPILWPPDRFCLRPCTADDRYRPTRTFPHVLNRRIIFLSHPQISRAPMRTCSLIPWRKFWPSACCPAGATRASLTTPSGSQISTAKDVTYLRRLFDGTSPAS